MKVSTLLKACILCAILFNTTAHAQTGGTKVFVINSKISIAGEMKCSVTPQKDGKYQVKGSGYFTKYIKPAHWSWSCLCMERDFKDYGPVSQGREGDAMFTYVESVGVYTLETAENMEKVAVVTTALEEYRELGRVLAEVCGLEYKSMFMK